MKFKAFIIICLFLLYYFNFNAQSYTATTPSNNVKYTNILVPVKKPMADWQKHWTKESVLAINELIEEYGYPDEYSPNRMHWIIPGNIKRTITYTENFLFYLPFETTSCTNDSKELIVRNYQN